MKIYRIFDIAIACDFVIPGLAELQQQDFDWHVSLADEAFGTGVTEWSHSWNESDGTEIMALARLAGIYLLKVNAMACFTIDFDLRRIRVFPENDCPEHTLAHILIDQVIPRIMCHRGRIVLHASAVELSHGRAVAFTGRSGQGKSTLASAFFSAGHRLVADDCLLLENRAGALYAMSPYPSLRLWPDSARALAGTRDANHPGFSEMAHYSNKQQLLLDANAATTAADWVRLERLYLLENEAAFMDAPEVLVSPAGGMASIMAIVEASFTLDPVSEESIRQNFEAVRSVANGVTVRRLSYPRNYAVLPEVLAAVKQDLHQ